MCAEWVVGPNSSKCQDQVCKTGSIVCSGHCLGCSFRPATPLTHPEVGFTCSFAVIDPTYLGATIVVPTALCLTIFTAFFTEGNKPCLCAVPEIRTNQGRISSAAVHCNSRRRSLAHLSTFGSTHRTRAQAAAARCWRGGTSWARRGGTRTWRLATPMRGWRLRCASGGLRAPDGAMGARPAGGASRL